MSSSIRQSELFAGQDWKALHKAFTEINFNAYDFDTIRLAMRDYIRMTYPEEFNDWIESSEFVAILDLLAYLGGALAFRVDMNAHENFIDTAEARESILRMARFLSYTPRRNYPARGLLKVVAVSTDDDVYDGGGQNLNGQTIIWDDAQNPDWFEQWTTVMNNAFTRTNQFGNPLKIGSVGGVRTHLYRFNSVPQVGNLFSFTRSVDANSLRFEVVNLDFEDFGTYLERTPDPLSSFHISYRNDGNGNTSPDTGFFLYFKQGELRSQTFYITEPQENRVIDIDDENVNELDVWVHNVDDAGFIDRGGYWRKVQTVQNNIFTGDNITYNDIPLSERNIYQVVTKDNDAISLRFSDGRFGNVPLGRVRCYYRVSAGTRYTIRPSDIENVNIVVPYMNEMGIQKNITLTLSLQNALSNSVPRETDEDIRRRAPQVYYTQNRMVSGEDYQNFPTQNNLARKIKAINRVYSGQSRYIDLNDPTGTYQNTNVFSDDGVLFHDYDEQYFEMPISSNINRTSTEILDDVIVPFIQNIKMKNFIWDKYLYNVDCTPDKNYGPWLVWQQANGSNESSTGTFRILPQGATLPTENQLGGTPVNANDQAVGPMAPASAPLLARIISETSLVKFANAGWVSLYSISGDGAGIVAQNNIGRVRLAENVKTNDYVVKVLPAFRTTLDHQETEAILEMLNSRKSFGIGYDYLNRRWYVIDPSSMKFLSDYDYSTKGTTEDSSWLISVQYSSDAFRIVGRGLVYIFESERDVRFYQFNTYKQYNQVTGLVDQDQIRILGINRHPGTMTAAEWTVGTTYRVGDYVNYNGTTYQCQHTHTASAPFAMEANGVIRWLAVNPSIGTDLQFGLVRSFVYRDGYVEPRRVQVSMYDSDNDGVPDNPEAFYQVIGTPVDKDSPQYIFWEKYVSPDSYEYFRPTTATVTRINRVVDRWVDVENPTGETTLVIGTNHFRSTALNNLHDGDTVLLLGQTQFQPSDSTRVGENHKVYRYDETNTRLVALSNPHPSLVWDFAQKEFWLYDATSLKYKRDEYDAYRWYVGRRGLSFQWKHLAPRDHRIDPAVTNIIDIFVLTSEYDTNIRNWVRTGKPLSELPEAPTELELRLLFQDLEQYKMFSDEIIWRPAKYRLLFGSRAEEEYRARFKVKKMETTTLSDGEIKGQVIRAINEFFQVSRWDFGETFDWSELSAYIHQRLATVISSIYMVPVNEEASFGNLVEIKCAPDELFLSVATVDDVVIIPANTQTNLRIR